jgi:hypothetical protein
MRRRVDRILFLSFAAIAAACRASCDRPTASCRPVIAPVAVSAVKEAPALGLPPGCEQISDGANWCLSSDGTLLSVVRWVQFGGRYAQGEVGMGLGAEPALAEPWVLDMRTREEWRLPRPRPPRPDVPNVNASMERVPIAWRAADALLLEDGSIVDPRRGEDVGSGLLPPADVDVVAWSPDGHRVACTVGPPGDKRVLIVELDGRARQVDLARANVRAWSLRLPSIMGTPPSPGSTSPTSRRLDGVSLQWSPRGHHAYFAAALHVPHGPEMTWVGVLRPDGSVRVLSEVEGFGGVPGRTKFGGRSSVWDGSGAWFAWTRVLARGKADVYVSSSDGSDSIRVTDDGAAKWCATLDPLARRVAFYVGDLDGNGYPSRTRIRVLDLLTGRSQELALALPDAYGLTWTPDGDRLLYEAYGMEKHGIFVQTVAPPHPVADGTPILRKPDPGSLVR